MTNQIKVPPVREIMWPTVQVLVKSGGAASNKELETAVFQHMGLPEEILSIMHNRQKTKFSYQLGWAKTNLKRLGLIGNTERGIWSLTEEGRDLNESDLIQISKEAKQERKHKNANTLEQGDSDDHEEGEAEEWKNQLLDVLLKMDPYAFERLAKVILLKKGFEISEVTGGTGDGGIDGYGIFRLNLLSFQVFFQCKRYSGVVGSPDMRNFRGAMQGRGDKGLFITTGVFSNAAKLEAARDGAPTIDLIDGNGLCDLLKELELGVKTEMVEKISVLPERFEAI